MMTSTDIRDIDHDADSADPETELAWLVTQRAAAMRHRDADGLVARYAPGVALFGAPELFGGTATTGGGDPRDPERMRSWLAGLEDSVEYSVRDLAVAVAGDLAVCRSLDRFTATPVGGRRFQRWLSVTVELHRRDGGWFITHEHRSPASDPQATPSE